MRVPSSLSTQTSQPTRMRSPSGVSSRTRARAVTRSSTHNTFTSFTDMRPPSSQPIPNSSCITWETKQVVIIPWTTMFGKPSCCAASRSVW
jgi:hypothetical protein